MARYRNRKKERIKKRADNRFTALSGLIVTKLTAPCDCWIVHEKEHNRLPIRKFAFACFDDWQKYEMSRHAKRMKNIRVKMTCQNEHCVNPYHMLGKELPLPLWGPRPKTHPDGTKPTYRPPAQAVSEPTTPQEQ